MKNIIITESQLKYIKEHILSEAQQNSIDNFNKIANLMQFNSSDDFYYVQIMQRFKDNPNGNKNVGNYHGGAWYLGGMRIHSAQELLNNKLAITSLCDAQNARAYITINTRSDIATDAEITKRRNKYPSSDARNIHADQIVPSQPKVDLTKFPDRLRYFADVDEPKNAFEIVSRVQFKVTGQDNHCDLVDIMINGQPIKGKKTHSPKPILVAYPANKNEEALLQNSCQGFYIWEKTHELFKNNNVPILDEYVTSSGGLHVIGSDYSVPEFKSLKRDLINTIDRGVDLDRLATVHLNIDGKLILYANVKTKGYEE